MAYRKSRWRRFRLALAVLFIGMNTVAAFHAWRFTHFTADTGPRIYNATGLPWHQKLKIALTGIENPRPETRRLPERPYRTITLQSDKRLEAWYLPADSGAKGTVILFHGYGAEKSTMLPKAYLLQDAGYQVLLPDFRGSGGSEGDRTTIGYHEGRDVKACFDYVQTLGAGRVYLLGTSMGAAAILKYISDGHRQPDGIILECPFGSMYQTVSIRFRMLGAPTFPMAGLLVFWGGLEHGFWGFGHNPEDYAKKVSCPALLLFGGRDDRVTREETDAIYRNLGGPKSLRTYPEAGHNNTLQLYPEEWREDVLGFLK